MTVNSLTSLRQTTTREVSRAIEAWRHFWFSPEDPCTLGIIRFLTGWMLAYTLLVWGFDLRAFFYSDGLQPLEAIRDFHSGEPIFSFLLYVSDDWLPFVHWACFLIAVLFCIGCATRITSVLCYLITISYSQRVPIANFGLDQILGLLCLYLAIGPSGASLSFDAWWKRRKATNIGKPFVQRKLGSARMSLRLIQLHLCVIYFWAGFAKLKGESWWTGGAMWQVIANEEYQTIDLTWMAWVPWLPFAIAHVTVAWEVFFGVLVWNRTLRPWMLLLGTAMHFGIGAFLGMWTFGLIMTYAYFSFSDPAAWRNRFKRWLPIADFAPDVLIEPAHLPPATGEMPGQISVEHEISSMQLKTALQFTENQPGVDLLDHKATLLLIAPADAERRTLRSYFARHDIPCKAVASPKSAFSLVSNSQPAAVMISGSQFTVTETELLIADLRDLVDVPILALVLPSHATPLSNSPARIIQYPQSPREIRHELSLLLFGKTESERACQVPSAHEVESHEA